MVARSRVNCDRGITCVQPAVSRLLRQIRLHVRKKRNQRQARRRRAHSLNRLQRRAARVQIHNHQLRRFLRNLREQRVARSAGAHRDSQLLRRLQNLRLKK